MMAGVPQVLVLLPPPKASQPFFPDLDALATPLVWVPAVSLWMLHLPVPIPNLPQQLHPFDILAPVATIQGYLQSHPQQQHQLPTCCYRVLLMPTNSQN